MLKLTEDQVRFFRARRGHLAGKGADDAPAAARAVVGIQAQVEASGIGIPTEFGHSPSPAHLQYYLKAASSNEFRSGNFF